MNPLIQHIVRFGASFIGRSIQRKFNAFMKAHQRTADVQDRLLAELISTHRNTTFGIDHRFDRINSIAEFRRHVPVSNYDTLRPYMDRVLLGETTALLPPGEPVEMFSMTSGTTGNPKHIPVTQRFAKRMKHGFTLFGFKALMDHPAAWLRDILQISSPFRETTSPTGLPCGAISGLMAKKQMRIVRRKYIVPPEATQIPDHVSKYYTTLRCSVEGDVSFITTANPSSTIRLIEIGQQYAEQLIKDVADGTVTPPVALPADLVGRFPFHPNRRLARRMEAGIERDGELLPRHFWNVTFLANWTGGTLKLYLPRLCELFDNVPVRDIGLLASEGRFSIPLEDETPAGVAEITSNLLEFIPADRVDEANPPILSAHQLDVGGEYVLVVSNWAGLWRYNMDDRVLVTDRIGNSPVFEFLSRGRNTASITGEKITEHQVVTAMQLADTKTGLTVDRFVMQGRFAGKPHYELRLEGLSTEEALHLAQVLDHALAQINIEYASKRNTGRLGPIQAVLLEPGTLDQQEWATIARRRGRSEQYKHQYLLTEVLNGPDSRAS
jgi:hypothetical protein